MNVLPSKASLFVQDEADFYKFNILTDIVLQDDQPESTPERVIDFVKTETVFIHVTN